MLTPETVRGLLLHLKQDLQEAEERIQTAGNIDHWASKRDRIARWTGRPGEDERVGSKITSVRRGMIGWQAADGPLYVVWGYHVEAIHEWRVGWDGLRIVAKVPGQKMMQVLTPGVDVFDDERAALVRCLGDIDEMRRFYDDRAEIVVRQIAALDSSAGDS